MDKPADELYQLTAFLDNELTEAEAEEVKRKIMKSDKWKNEYERLKELDQLLRLWDEVELKGIKASSSYESKLIQRLRSSEKRPVTSAVQDLPCPDLPNSEA
ncbi:MAG TPA: hypothetical protein VM123_15720 [archaeon]|nr:hypothetical protein [archaeon]